MDLAERGQRVVEHGLYSTLFMVALGIIIALAGWSVRLHFELKEANLRLDKVQEARVQDGKDGERRAEKLADRMAVHMDRAAETAQTTNVILLAMKQGEGK